MALAMGNRPRVLEPPGGDRRRPTRNTAANPGSRNRAEEYEAHGEVLEYDPPRLLVWSWIANWHEHPANPTLVRWELTPAKDGTRVVVTHSGLAREHIARKDYGPGWQGVLRLLRHFFQK